MHLNWALNICFDCSARSGERINVGGKSGREDHQQGNGIFLIIQYISNIQKLYKREESIRFMAIRRIFQVRGVVFRISSGNLPEFCKNDVTCLKSVFLVSRVIFSFLLFFMYGKKPNMCLVLTSHDSKDSLPVISPINGVIFSRKDFLSF